MDGFIVEKEVGDGELSPQFDETTLTLLMVGPHENFYRDLKKNT